MTGRSQGGIGRTRLARGENAAKYDRLMSAPVVLQVAASPVSPALVLRPWRMEDVAALVEVSRDPALRQWASHVVSADSRLLTSSSRTTPLGQVVTSVVPRPGKRRATTDDNTGDDARWSPRFLSRGRVRATRGQSGLQQQDPE
jgi:hypothetical protein